LGKLRVLSGRDVCRILFHNGFAEKKRSGGSHIVMQKKTVDSTITVIIPDHKEICVGTLLSIIRQSRLSRSFFEE